MATAPLRPTTTAAIAALVTVAVLTHPQAAAASPKSHPLNPATTLTRRALSDLVRASWCETTAVEQVHGERLEATTIDGPQEGVQVFRSGRVRVTIELAPTHVAYLRASTLGLEAVEGLPPARAKALAGRWLAVRPGGPNYAALVAGVTTASLARDLLPRGPLHEGATTELDGEKVVPVIGSPATRGSTGEKELDVTATATPLPVALAEPGAHLRVGIYDVGHAHTLAFPANAVALRAHP